MPVTRQGVHIKDNPDADEKFAMQQNGLMGKTMRSSIVRCMNKGILSEREANELWRNIADPLKGLMGSPLNRREQEKFDAACQAATDLILQRAHGTRFGRF